MLCFNRLKITIKLIKLSISVEILNIHQSKLSPTENNYCNLCLMMSMLDTKVPDLHYGDGRFSFRPQDIQSGVFSTNRTLFAYKRRPCLYSYV